MDKFTVRHKGLAESRFPPALKGSGREVRKGGHLVGAAFEWGTMEYGLWLSLTPGDN